MAKDPAILFYTSDFISGTLTMTDEQRGQYIMLLCLQHQKGFLTEKDMIKICKSYDEDIWCKFTEDKGKYYNNRMREEIDKRKKYSESRSQNRKGKIKDKKHMKNICKSYDKHMENVNENINKDNTIPEYKEFKEYALTKKQSLDLDSLKLKYDSWKENNWRDGNNKKIVNWKSKLLNTIPYLKIKENNTTAPYHKKG